MSDDYGFGGLFVLGKIMAVLLAIFVPLGLWKAVEIVIWLIHYVSVHLK